MSGPACELGGPGSNSRAHARTLARAWGRAETEVAWETDVGGSYPDTLAVAVAVAVVP